MSERTRFSIDGRPAEADAGHSLLAALWNSGVRAVRSSVSGEPRGPLCGMGTCFECRVTVDGEPHVRACLTPLREGMDVRTRELGTTPRASASSVPPPATHPASTVRPPGEPPRPDAVRLGRSGLDGERLEAEVVVVGGGPAGLAAAVHAAEAGARTLLVDGGAQLGGQIWRHRGDPPPAARGWLARAARTGVRSLHGATVIDATGDELLADLDGRSQRVRYTRLVLATGARELFLPFPGWTLPGVVGAGGAQALLKAGARFDGRRVVVGGSGPLLVAVAAALAQAGARVVGIAEQAPPPRLVAFGAGLWRAPRKLAEAAGYGLRLVHTPYRTGSWVRAVEPKDGGLRATLTDGRREWTWDCDVVACGFGLVPSLELPRLLGCDTAADGVRLGPAQETSRAGVFAAGELGGVAGVEAALVTGAIAGLAAAGRPVPDALARRREAELAFGARLARAFALRDELRALARPETPVCRCEDVARGTLAGLASAREAKLATRAGMGPCQGRVCSPALGFLCGFEPDSVRPPLFPSPLGVLEDREG